MKWIGTWLAVVVFLAAAAATRAADEAPLFDVPQLDNITVDGSPADWGDDGFRVEALGGVEGRMPPADDFDAAFRLGWDARGLLLVVTVSDDVPLEHPDEKELFRRDSVEPYISTRPGSPQYYEAVFAPGTDPSQAKLRHFVHDWRKDKSSPEELTVHAAMTETETGYVLEALLPWENLAIEPQVGDEVGFQLCANDADNVDERFRASWHPNGWTYDNPSAMHRLRLATEPGPPVLAAVGGEYERLRRIRIDVRATGEWVGDAVAVTAGDQVLASTNLAADAGRAFAHLFLPVPPTGAPYGALTVLSDGELIGTVELTDADEPRAREMMTAKLHFAPAVFSGEEFPPCDFARPARAEDLIGPYAIRTTFYDGDYDVATSAERPGRYGAIVEITPEQGRAMRRFRTLFRLPEDVDWREWRGQGPPVSLRLPKQAGIDPAVADEQSGVVGEYVRSQFVAGFGRDDRAAALLAGLYETEPGSGQRGVSSDVWAVERQWWTGLKRKLSGMDEAYPEPVICPRPTDGSAASVLREGALAEAGMTPSGIEKIDAVCKAWAADSDEAFAVCIARHGVIAYHRAYGLRDGRPMVVTDKSWMASITKLLSGTLMMMLVDHGLVHLDDRVDKFVPALRGIDVEVPLTIRHLYTHTNGLWGHWGDDLHDFEEVLAGYYPYLKVGQSGYNGAGYALAGKVIEAVSGEAVPQFTKRHLLQPLGCADTDVVTMSWDCQSTPLDIATIGQMLLNRGAYGRMRFFSEQTFETMLPEKLTRLLGPDTKIEGGIGVHWIRGEGLGEGTFGHGAASAATFRIDPANDLVVVMTRNRAGTGHAEYHPQFMAAIADSLVAQPDVQDRPTD